MLAFLEEATMDASKIPEPPRAREVREKEDAIPRRGEARGEVRAEVDAQLTVLSARGLAVSEADRERVRACAEPATLDRWIARAATATSVDEALA
jgi:hypothetical protein